jgi:hypothetical protein
LNAVQARAMGRIARELQKPANSAKTKPERGASGEMRALARALFGVGPCYADQQYV